MKKIQKCNVCGEKLLLTEITTIAERKVWVYMCGCDEMIRQAKAFAQKKIEKLHQDTAEYWRLPVGMIFPMVLAAKVVLTPEKQLDLFDQ